MCKCLAHVMDSQELSEPSLEDNLRLIADQYRRLILQYLIYESSGPVSFDVLVEYLAEHVVAGSNRETIRSKLHHDHLPRMADHGVVEYDPRSGSVRYHSQDPIETILVHIPDE